MSKTKYSPEVGERAVRLVREHQWEYGSQWAAIESIAAKVENFVMTKKHGNPPTFSGRQKWS
ncbi:hypothetical protein [Xanthomonas phaseoli]|uniref:hypothetical protein n=1 Tax=Xanthomonas phaseoli TaxID=1985254 RepID=UPI0009B61C51|nr:hypothetical protein [Xanthomonas phaseoli]